MTGTEGQAGSTAGPPSDRPGRRGTLDGAVVAAILVLAVIYVVGTVGPPLFGRGVFLASDLIDQAYPWRAFGSAAAFDYASHGPTSDTVDVVFPYRSVFAEHLRHGDLLSWNPWVAGGVSSGSNAPGPLDPFALAYVVLPAWFAPAFIKALQATASAGFTFLFCRRLGVGRPAALFAGVAFAGSGFMVMWSNWPQTDVAALIPALFWATERFLQRRTVAAAVPVAGCLAAMLAGTFPAIVGYAGSVLVPYVAVRLLTERDRPLPARLGTGIGAGAALVAGVLLAAVVLLPFARASGDIDLEARRENPDHHLTPAALVTAVAPKALGLSTEGPGFAWFGPYNQVETVSFVGATTCLLALAGACLRAPRHAPRGARGVLVASTVVLGAATYWGGTVLRLLQELPIYGSSFIGRTRSMLGFTVAVLAGLGAQALLERARPDRARQWVPAAAVLAGAAFVAYRAVATAHASAVRFSLGAPQRDRLILPAVVGGLAVAAAAALWSGRRAAVAAGVVALPALLVVESLALSLPLLPNEARSTLYPETPAHRFFDRTLGDDRLAVEGLTFFSDATMMTGYRSAGGHAFYPRPWKQMLLAADPGAFARSPTVTTLRRDPAVVTSPILDRLAVRWFAAAPDGLPFGQRVPAGLATASCDAPVPLGGRPPGAVSVPLPGARVRGVVLRICARTDLPPGAVLTGRMTPGGGPGASAVGRLELADQVPPGDLALAVPAEDLGGSLSLSLDLEDAGGRTLPLATAAGAIAVDTVQATDDGLRLAYAHDLQVYERTRALPRVRWAAGAVAIPDGAERLAALSSGKYGDGTVVLDHGPVRAGGRPAGVAVEKDGDGEIRATVDAQGDGYLVVADALQRDWVAEVDGERAGLQPGDHAGVAVAVPEGRHAVVLRHRPRAVHVGAAISAVSAAGLAAAVVVERWWRRDRR